LKNFQTRYQTTMSEANQEYYETVSGKFAAYDLLLAHLLRKTMATMSEEGTAALQDDLLRQLNFYTAQPSLPEAARLSMQTTVTEIWQKADFEFRNGVPLT
jgi:hypothetical protein